MWRTRAILSLLVDNVAQLRSHQPPAENGESHETALAQTVEESFHALNRAKKRATMAIAIDWLAIAVLFFFRPEGEPFLSFGANPRTVFSAGILAVAIHSGFRLGQLEKFRAVERACRELSEREAS